MKDHRLGDFFGDLLFVHLTVAIELGDQLCGFINAHQFSQHGLVIGRGVACATRKVRGLNLFFQVLEHGFRHGHVHHHAPSQHHLT